MENIIDKAFRVGLAPDNIVREILQELILYSIANTNLDKYYVFQGGTALRIIYGSPRFSLDIDLSLINKEIETVSSDARRMRNIMDRVLSIDRIDVDIAGERLIKNEGFYRCYFTFDTKRFMNKKIRIKLEINTARYKGITFPRRIVDIDYPFKTSVAIQVKNPDQLLSDKIASLAGGFHRKMIRWRDVFDIYWIKNRLNGYIDRAYLLQEFGSWIGTTEDLREIAHTLREIYREKKYEEAINELQRLLPPNLSKTELISEYIRQAIQVLDEAMEMMKE